jgi:glucose 1-dehydrogenase
MTLPLSGQVALITGASGGIGAACVRALADAGADIAGCDLRFSQLGESASEHARQLGRRVFTSTFNIADEPACAKFVSDADRELGGIHLHVSAAVYSDREPFTTADFTGFRKTIDISLWGSFFVLRAVANVMIRQQKGGAIVIVSSPHSVVPFPNCMAYNMAKAAQDSMARTAAIELLKHKIRVNILHPGWTDTPGERKFYSEEDLAKAAKTLPLGRLSRPDEMARGVLFLLDPASESVNGITLTMDGGLSLPWWSKRGEGAL